MFYSISMGNPEWIHKEKYKYFKATFLVETLSNNFHKNSFALNEQRWLIFEFSREKLMISPMRTELEDLYLAAINFIRYKKKYLDSFLLAFGERRDNIVNSDNVKRAKIGLHSSELIQTSYSKQVHLLTRTYSQLLSFIHCLVQETCN